MKKEEVDQTIFDFRLSSTLNQIKELIVRIDDAITNRRTKDADKLLKKIDDLVVNFVMGEEVDLKNLASIKKDQKI